ncbi:ProQ/FinO family protein [Oceanospirillaceae bacterium]|nr:ProQ/FinO family protein [Oceanospirillaceae bacterium]
MTDSKLKNLGTLELTQKLSERIKTQQNFLIRQQRHVDTLRQEHQQLKQQVEQGRSQIFIDNQNQDIMTSTSELPITQETSTLVQTELPETTSSLVAEPVTSESAASGQVVPEITAAERKKAKSRAANRAAVELICETYPQAFCFAKPRPLKIGIQEDLVADGKLSQTKIKRGLASYVRAFGYLKSQTDAAPRINLLGEAQGAVTADEAAHALTKLPAPRKPNKPRPSAKKRPEQVYSKPKRTEAPKSHKPQPKIEKAPSPFDGLNEGQRMATKLDLLLKKNK